MLYEYQSSITRYLSWLLIITFTHLAVTSFLMFWSFIIDSMETYYIAIKLLHPWVTALAIYYLAGGYEKTQLEKKTSAYNYFKIVFGWLIFFTALIFVADLVYLGVIHIPTIIKCYRDDPPLPDVCNEKNERTVYTITGVASVIHIILEFLLGVFAIIIYIKPTEEQKPKEDVEEEEDDLALESIVGGNVSRIVRYPSSINTGGGGRIHNRNISKIIKHT